MREPFISNVRKILRKKKFLPPDTHMYVCVSQNEKHYFFGGILRTYYMNDPEASS